MADHNDRYFMPAMTPSEKGCAASEGWSLEDHIIGQDSGGRVEEGGGIVGLQMYKAELRTLRLKEKGLAWDAIQGRSYQSKQKSECGRLMLTP